MTVTDAGWTLLIVAALCGTTALIKHLFDRARHPRTTTTTVHLDDMPDHPERIRHLDDPLHETQYWEIAERLLDDGLARVNHRWGWTR